MHTDHKPRPPYNWDLPPPPGADDLQQLLELPVQQWHRPVSKMELAFWRGVAVGGLVEAFFILLAVVMIWLFK